METADFRRELDRRLAVLEDPERLDPASRDLPTSDWVVLLVASVVLIGAALAWGYPW